ncbi:MAG: guanylate kinase [Phycisphaerales bacterium]|nr:MAG: guanylate kinase [Phycisphaerales bacterium]
MRTVEARGEGARVGWSWIGLGLVGSRGNVLSDAHERLPTDTDDGLLLIISGPSGVGKTTITRGVERSIAGSVFSVSCTTRPKTDADVEGVDYHFVDDETFERMSREGEFLESADVFGKKYATPREWVDEQLKRGRLVILEIDVEGAKQVKSKMPRAFGVFILPPSEETLLQRLRDRKRESEAQIQKRFAEAQHEMHEAKASGVYDVFIVNRELDRAIEEAVSAVRERRGR